MECAIGVARHANESVAWLQKLLCHGKTHAP